MKFFQLLGAIFLEFFEYVGGLGLRMMKTCMDDFRYEARPEGGARLILTKLHSSEERTRKERKAAVTEKGHPKR